MSPGICLNLPKAPFSISDMPLTRHVKGQAGLQAGPRDAQVQEQFLTRIVLLPGSDSLGISFGQLQR